MADSWKDLQGLFKNTNTQAIPTNQNLQEYGSGICIKRKKATAAKNT